MDVKERQILFNAEMVRAILDGRKTQTRRPVKIQPPNDRCKLMTCVSSTGNKRDEGKHHWAELGGIDGLDILPGGSEYFTSPYGYNGDRLWVRECFAFAGDVAVEPCEKKDILYRSGYPSNVSSEFENVPQNPDDISWRPSVHMPRWASRITLEIKNTRIERVQEISRADAKAEGFFPSPYNGLEKYDHKLYGNAENAFEACWESIYAKRGFSWESNPYVWVVEFERIDQ